MASPGGSHPPFTVPLRELRAGDVAACGGKAANLGELLGAGFPVPDGFCLTTGAYRLAAAASGVNKLLETSADVVEEFGTEEHRAALAARARDLLLGAAVPADVERSLRAAYSALGPDVPVAVRSSATTEDLPFASFAGQQDSYLNVVGPDALLDAVRRCWASLWTDRAVSYRAAAGFDIGTAALAVVVQEMVDAEAAGVMFTANPVTGRRREAVIDANPGLGEAVVSGAVDPDHFVVDLATRAVLARRPGRKELAVRAVRGGGTERVPAVREPAPGLCLTDGQLKALARLGGDVEDHFGQPQDIEWALDSSGTIRLTQSRPITTLYPVPHRRDGAAGERAYFCLSLAQGLTRPLTPMGLAAFRLIGAGAARRAGVPVTRAADGPPPYADPGLRLFVDVTAVLHSRFGRMVVPRVFDVMEARSAAVLRELTKDPRFALGQKSALPVAARLAGIALRTRMPGSVLQAIVRPEESLRRLSRLGERISAAVRPSETAGRTPEQRLDWVEWLLTGPAILIVPAVLPAPAVGFAMLALARSLLVDTLRPTELETVLRGLPGNVTTEMDLELWQLAVRLKKDLPSAELFGEQDVSEVARCYLSGTLPQVAQAELAAFLARWGHRAVGEIDVGMPRWSEDPRHLIGVLANYLRLEDPELAPTVQFARGARDAEAMIRQLAARARRRGRLRGRLVELCLRRARQLAGCRELPKFRIVEVLAAVRRELALVGEDLAASGRTDQPGDIFFLDTVEAREGLHGTDLRALVAGRRNEYERELRRRHVPRLLLSDGTEPEAVAPAAPSQDGALSGSPASSGVVTARARVVLDPVGAHLEPGEILVAPSTDPGWTPLFLTAGGLVMEMGGANSHGAVVAREYGIPAIVGVQDATLLISTGELVTLDGAAGTVRQAGGQSRGNPDATDG